MRTLHWLYFAVAGGAPFGQRPTWVNSVRSGHGADGVLEQRHKAAAFDLRLHALVELRAGDLGERGEEVDVGGERVDVGRA